jgi:hypothetical protein
MTLHPGYAATQISSNLNGSTKQFGWLQASATSQLWSKKISRTGTVPKPYLIAVSELTSSEKQTPRNC